MSNPHVGIGDWDLSLGNLCRYDKNLHESAVFKGCNDF